MTKKYKGAKDECKWIDEHPFFYRDEQHREDVKHNIRTNYCIRELEAEAAVLRRTLRHANIPSYTSINCQPIAPTAL